MIVRLKNNYVKRFQEIYDQEFEISLSFDEAYSQCMDMVELGRVVYRAVSEDEVKRLPELSDE